MHYQTFVQRIGEWFPFDETYDFSQHAWKDGRGGTNPEYVLEGEKAFRKIVADPEGWKYYSSGGGIFDIVKVGMYDGWPFWVPTPAIGYIGPLGGVEIAFFYNLAWSVGKK